ncbi:MAG: ATP-binding cassette domain-containing protein [Sphaerochaetaceae bacterium]|nr:ATP-binding cassette domain-containing protein [Sphaerochaetaceae bacterium]
MNNFIELKDVTANFGKLSALKKINFNIKSGEVRALTGVQGSGKTTLAKIIAGKRNIQKGLLLINGEDSCNNKKIFFSNRIEYVPQGFSLVNHFSIAKSFYLFKRNNEKDFFYNKSREVQNIKEFFELWNINLDPKELIGNLYLSDQMLISILQRIYRDPRFLILDESLDSLSASSYDKVSRIIKTKNEMGMGCLIISQDIENTKDMAQSISIMNKGEILSTENLKDIDTFNIIKLTYANFRKHENSENARDFYQLLKYNEAILESLPVNIIILDKKNQIRLINNSAADFFGVDGNSMIGFNFDALISSNDKGLIDLILEGLKKKNKINIINQIIHLKEKIKNINISIYPVEENEQIIGEMLIFFDTSETVKLREKISFIDKMSSISILSAGIAHEINNPLGIINNCLDFLSNELVDSEQKNVINEVEEEIVSISKIISSLTSYTSQKVNSHIKFNVEKLINSVCIFFKYFAREKGVTLYVNDIEQDLFGSASISEVKQILLNVLKNSVEAMKKGGDIYISSKPSNNNKEVLIIIEDNGPGLNLKNMSDVFLPFYSTKVGENIGLGLYISYSLAQKNKGNLQVVNVSPHGCKFTLSLPKV